MSINTPIVFIGIPLSNLNLDDTVQSFLHTKMSHVAIEPITVLDGKSIPQWNFSKAYFVDVAPADPTFNLLVSEFGGNDGSDLDSILLGVNTKAHYLKLFETLLEQQSKETL
jgi:hypothetical protein